MANYGGSMVTENGSKCCFSATIRNQIICPLAANTTLILRTTASLVILFSQSGKTVNFFFSGAGFLIRLDCFDSVDTQELFDDRLSWNVADPEAASFVEVRPLRKPPPRPPIRFKNRVMSIMRDARPAL